MCVLEEHKLGARAEPRRRGDGWNGKRKQTDGRWKGGGRRMVARKEGEEEWVVHFAREVSERCEWCVSGGRESGDGE